MAVEHKMAFDETSDTVNFTRTVKMDDNSFWLRLWALAAIVTMFIAASIASVPLYEKHVVATAIKGGADPMRATCAMLLNSTRIDASKALVCAGLAR